MLLIYWRSKLTSIEFEVVLPVPGVDNESFKELAASSFCKGTLGYFPKTESLSSGKRIRLQL